MREDRDKNTECREHQNDTEDRIDTADQLVDRQAGRQEIVGEDDNIHDPGRRIGRRAGPLEDLRRRNVAGRVDEHRADKQQKQADEYIIQNVYGPVCVILHKIRHLCAAVPRADHAREIVVHRAADHVADRNRQKRRRPEQNTLNRSHDRTCSGNVQQVDQAVPPCLHGDIVHAVLPRIGRRLAVVRSENILAELTVQRAAADKNHETDKKCCHVMLPSSWPPPADAEGVPRRGVSLSPLQLYLKAMAIDI